MDSNRYRLSSSESDKIAKCISRELFAGAIPVGKPQLIILAGQPGSGKTTMAARVVEEFSRKGGAVRIRKGLLSAHHPLRSHPAYHAIQKSQREIAFLFRQLVAEDLENWRRKLIRQACEQHYNVVLEFHISRPDIGELIATFREAGYKVEIRALAVPSEVSWQGVLLRREMQHAERGWGRMVSPDRHRADFDGTSGRLEEIEKRKLADSVRLVRRAGSLVYENTLKAGKWREPPHARLALSEERSRLWTLQELAEYGENFDRIIAMMEARKAARQETLSVRHLQAEAYNKLGAQNAKAHLTYRGPVEALTENSVYQRTDAHGIVRHDRIAFKRLPQMGQHVSVRYQSNCAEVVQLGLREVLGKKFLDVRSSLHAFKKRSI
jgi:predicted ABC-type ATPase